MGLDELENMSRILWEALFEQLPRLQLFRLLEARKGYRQVKFAGRFGQWSNCWERPARIAEPRFVGEKNQSILEVVPGGPA
jgi:hypothetical protein